jgi:hypothetical protein
MTNKELIQLLSKYPEDLEVRFHHFLFCNTDQGYISENETMSEVYLGREDGKDIILIE